MASRNLLVRDCPDDIHDYLEQQARVAATSKQAVVVALLREAQRLGLAVGVTASGRSGT